MADLIVEVEQGKLKGKTGVDCKGKEFFSFQGIPYAKPPLGELRFKAPVPPESWQGVRNATVEASECYARHDLFYEKIVGSEDCLYLNVYTPQLPSNEKVALKPVMFWIHGGGFNKGSSKTEFFGPEILMTGNVVLVSINYRLGLLGFLRLLDPALGVPGNAGMKDMVMALKWVKGNIKNFSGDPNNVTIFGISAGGAAVHALVLSPMAKGLFHRAIMQSGCTLNFWVIGEEKATTIVRTLGHESTDEEDALKFLRTVPVEKILEAQEKLPDDFCWDHIRPFGLVVEKDANEPMFFQEHPLDIIKSGNYNKVPLIMGFTSNEGMFLEVHHTRVFGKLHIDTDFERKIPYYLNVPKGTELSLRMANKIKEGYYGSATPSIENAQTFFDIWSDMAFIRGIYKSMKEHLKNLQLPIYFYLLSAHTEVNYMKKLSKSNRAGACHADDVGYLFKTSYLPAYKENSKEELVTQRIVKLWTNFARNGNPNSGDKDPLIKVTWKPVKEGQYNCLDLGTDLELIANPYMTRMKVWDEISTLSANANQ